MKITYFHRNPHAGYSIGKVARNYITEVEKTERAENIYMPSAKGGPISVLKNMWYAYKHRNKCGVNHITGGAAYLALVLPAKHIVATVHDIGWDEIQAKMNPLKVLWYNFLILYPLSRCSAVVCISDYTKRELLKAMPNLESRVHLIPNAVGTEFIHVKKDFDQNRPVILHIGNTEPADRKNLLRTIEALRGLPVHLRIIGHLNEHTISLLRKYQTDYSNAYDLTDEQLVEEYQQCDIVNFPSLYEGFGMPIIEGQASGRIVVTSNISPMIDVAGAGAAVVDPYDVDDIRECYLNIINNASVRKNLLERGFENVARYQAANIAQQYIKLYRYL